MPDPLDVSPDAARQAPGSAELDPTGLDGMTDIMVSARQVASAARIAGFTPDQALQFARDYFTTMLRISIERNGQ